jgi:hypothetical protein
VVKFPRMILHGLPVIVLLSLSVAVVAPGRSRAATPTLTTLVSFCALANCSDGGFPHGTLIADAMGNLFGTTGLGGTNGYLGPSF